LYDKNIPTAHPLRQNSCFAFIRGENLKLFRAATFTAFKEEVFETRVFGKQALVMNVVLMCFGCSTVNMWVCTTE